VEILEIYSNLTGNLWKVFKMMKMLLELIEP